MRMGYRVDEVIMVHIPTLEGVPEGSVWATVLKDKSLDEPSDEEMKQRLDFSTLNKKYLPVGKCIYCLAEKYSSSRCQLGLEHIIPESIGGHLRLPDSSCEECERRINTVERSLRNRYSRCCAISWVYEGSPGRGARKKGA